MQHSAHRRDREIGRQVFGVVPHERRDPLVSGNAEAAQRIRQPGGLLAQLAVGAATVTVTGGGGDGAGPVDGAAVSHDRGDGQRKVLHGAVH